MSKAPKGFFRRRKAASSVEKAAAKLGDTPLNAGRSASAPPPAAGAPVSPPVPPPVQPASANLTPARPAGAFNGARGSVSRRIEINHELLSAAGLISNRSEHSQIAEEFRLIKRPILLQAFEDRGGSGRAKNLIMVSSAKPGEGKTFSAVNLAMSIALERDLTVMLIDADIVHPSIPSAMGFEAELGLMDLIADESLDMSDVLLRTDVENLTVLPAGRPHHLATELFASDRMARLVADITRRYPDRIIIVDSPPILMSSIPGVLALHVGQIVFVVQAEKSTQAAIDGALGLVGSCENIYLLLNKARNIGSAEKFDGYYDYYR